MKLFELIEPKTTEHEVDLNPEQFDTLKKNTGSYDTDLPPKNPKVQILGHGIYAAAIKGSSTPQVIKISKGTPDPAKDAYLMYLRTIFKNGQMLSNPCFPRIYKLKIYKNNNSMIERNKKYFYFCEMEPLAPLQDCPVEELLQFYKKITAKPDRRFSDQEFLAKEQGEALDALGSRLSNSLHYPEDCPDPMMKKAVMLIDKIYQDSNISLFKDMHYGNVMVRRTSVGPQLVITDPLGNSAF